MVDGLHLLAVKAGEALAARGWRVATAESCTGGWVAKALTDVAGSSGYVDRGFVTYSNEAKEEMLGVRPETLDLYGAVSEATVREMAEGAIARSLADVALSISGIAGPTGGSERKPVGTVCFAWALRDGVERACTEHFDGDREAVRHQAAEFALAGLLTLLETVP